MANQLNSFRFDSEDLRVLTIEGEPWFVAKDVCSILFIKEHRRALARLDKDEKGVRNMTSLGGNQNTLIINEAGLYRLMMTSRTPGSKRFQKWVVGEVLPTIRKTGSYTVPSAQLETIERIASSSIVQTLISMASCVSETISYVPIPGHEGYYMDTTPKHDVWRIAKDGNKELLKGEEGTNRVSIQKIRYLRQNLIDKVFPRLSPELLRK